MSLGFEAAGFDIVAAVELDPVNAATHEYNFPFCPVICADARAVSAEHILRSANLRAGDIDVVFGGPPCQGFSIIGKRSPSDPRNQGLFHFHRIIHELKPRLFVLENVPGLTSLGTHLRRFIAKCRVSGYDIVDPFEVLDAAQYGVPQERRRVFLYGFLDGLAPPMYPTPTHRSRSRSIRNGKNGRGPGHEALPFGPTVSEAIGDLPDVNKIAALRHSESVPWQLESGSEYARRLHGDIADPFDFSYQRIFDKTLLTCSQRIEHSPECRARFRKTRPGSTEPLSRLVKLSADGVSHTLRAGTLPDKGSFMAPRPIHPTSSRCITVREAARLHSYPDWFRFHVTKWHGFRQIGNSVPPLLARAVAATVMKALGATPTKPDHPVELRNQWKLSIAFSKSSVGIAPTRRYAGLRKAKRKHDPK